MHIGLSNQFDFTLQCLMFSFELLNILAQLYARAFTFISAEQILACKFIQMFWKPFNKYLYQLMYIVFVYQFTHRLWHIWLVFVVDCCVKHLYKRGPILKDSMLFMKVTIRDIHAWSTSIHIFTFTNQGVLTFLPLFSKSMYLYFNCVLI